MRTYATPSYLPSAVWKKISNNTTASATGYWHRWFRLWKSCVFNKQPDASQQANSNHIIRHATKHRPAKHADRLFSTGRDQPLPYFRGIFDFRQRYVRLLLYKCRFICPLCRLFPSRRSKTMVLIDETEGEGDYRQPAISRSRPRRKSSSSSWNNFLPEKTTVFPATTTRNCPPAKRTSSN